MQVTQQQYQDFVKGLFARNEGDLSKDFAHAAMGMATESFHEWTVALANFDKANAMEELGDFQFFMTAALMVLSEYVEDAETAGALRAVTSGPLPEFGAATSQIKPLSAWESPVDALLEPLCFILDVAKGWVGYGKKPTAVKVLRSAIYMSGVYAEVLVRTARMFDVTPYEMAQKACLANIDKLKGRYPGGFSLEASVNRDTAREREILDAHQRQEV